MIGLLFRFGGGGKAIRAVVALLIGFESSCFTRTFCVVWIRDGGGLSNCFFMSFSVGRGGRMGRGASISGGDVGR